MGHVPFVLTVVTIGSVLVWTGCKGCSTNDLPGEIVHCFHGNSVRTINTSDVADENVACIVKQRQKEVVYKCVEQTWAVERATDALNVRIRHKRFFLGSVFGGIACALTFFSCLWMDRPKPRDNVPPVLVCPMVQPVYAEWLQTYAKVDWEEPVANDNVDHTIIPRRYGRIPGRHFPEGKSTVNYTAKDRSGNSAKCTVIVRVNVKRCQSPGQIHDGYFICHPSADFVQGTTCRIGCFDGFDLVGDNVITCVDEVWKYSQQPRCAPWQCPKPGEVDGAGAPDCTNHNYFRSICSYKCKLPGYDMPPKVSNALVCTKSKRWQQSGYAKCIDVEPPEFETCPSVVVTGTDTGSSRARVYWESPKGSDNSQHPTEIIQSSGPLLESTNPSGQYKVVYSIKDSTGNKGNDCSFTVVIRDIKCPKIYPTPYLNVSCPMGTRTGSICEFSCTNGKTRIGDSNVKCERSRKGLFGEWDWHADHQPICKSSLRCPVITPPKNGAIACDNWVDGIFCQPQCRNGTKMPNSARPEKLYVCGKNHDWIPASPRLKDCTVPSDPRKLLHLTGQFFFNGDCRTPEANRHISQNFIQGLTSSNFNSFACKNPSSCKVENVQVFCGENGRRKKRTDEMELSVKISLSIARATHDIFEMTKEYADVIDKVTDVMANKLTEILPDIPVTFLNVTSNGVQTICATGSVATEDRLNCVECPSGTFYQYGTDEEDPTCHACAKGTYQDNPGKSNCKRCSHEKTTHGVGSRTLTDCKDACGPGSYSTDGLHPCSLCDIGYYQLSYGQTTCHRCPSPKTTVTFGSSSRRNCEVFDVVFNNAGDERSNVSAIAQLSSSQQLETFSLAIWIRVATFIEDHSSMVFAFIDEANEPVWTVKDFRNIFDHTNIKAVKADFLPADDKWHAIEIIYDHCNTTVAIDGITIRKDVVYGECRPINASILSITAGYNTSVSISNLNIWNGIHTVSSRKCHNADGGDVFSWQDIDDAEMDKAYVQFPSECDDFENCASMPCVHGDCVDRLHDFACECWKGYSGKTCEINTDDCEANVCINGATCIDGLDSYTCACPIGFTGQFCEIEMVDGGWSGWENWSECTTSCDDGVIIRKRICNNPEPDHGGSDCVGKMLDSKECNNTDCPVCPESPILANGTVDCDGSNESIHCSIKCLDGYDFDIEPMEEYYCGPETFHIWNFQTEDNPERRLPKCFKISIPEELSIHYSVKYKDLFCNNGDVENEATKIIETTVHSVISRMQCVTSNTCSVTDIMVTSCDASVRNKRDTSTAGFSLRVSSKIQSDNSSIEDLEEAFDFISDTVNNGGFTVDVLEEQYELDLNQTTASGDAACGAGETRVNYYCIPCGSGSYLVDGYCKPCTRGTYQEHQGQTSCLHCPAGKTTVGEGSDNSHDCSVEEIIDEYQGLKVTGIIVGCVVGVVAVAIAILIYRRYRSSIKKANTITDINLVSSPNDILGPSKTKFQSRGSAMDVNE